MILFKEKNQLLWTVVLSILYCIGLIIYNINYLDDYGRYLLGYSGLSGNGRPIADLVLTIINFGYPLLDLSPLSLLFSIFIIAISGSIIADRFFKDERPVIRCLVALFFLVNPFFIENLSFKYDILPMSLSILSISLAFYHMKNRFLKMAAPVFLIFISLGLYQATLGMFVIFSIIELTESIINNRGTHKSRFINACSRAVQLIIAYMLYKLIIVNYFIAGDYASNLSKTITISPEGFTTLMGNFHRFNEFVGSYIESIPLVMISFYAISLLTSVWILTKKSWESSKSILNVIILLASPFLFYLFSFATFLFLEHAAVTSRVMISFSATLVGFSFYMLLAIKKPKFKLIVLLPFFIFSYVLSTSYVNASMAQNRKDSRIINSIYNDISHLSPQVKFVNFSGVVSPAPQKALALMRFPILKDLTKSYLGTDWSAYMLNYNGINVSRMNFSSEEVGKICSQKAISETSDYKIYVSGENMIISFDNLCN